MHITSHANWNTKLMINGHLTSGDGEMLRVENPATGDEITCFRQASVGQVNEAIDAAHCAFESGVWSDGAIRREALLNMAALMEEHKKEIGFAIIEEVGTPLNLIAPLQIGVPMAALRYYADLATKDYTRVLGADIRSGASSESVISYSPVGVVAAITAYNYPVLMMWLKLAPALAAGCTAVLMPSPQTPLSTLLFGKLIERAGFPPGTLNILVGGSDIGTALTSSHKVAKISFTGSSNVGSAVMSQAAANVTGVVLELGGKSASIILPETCLESHIAAIHLRYLRNAGQGCASPTRILVHQDSFTEFLDLSHKFYSTVKVGDPLDLDTVCGPLISETHRSWVEGFVERAVSDGAKVVAGGGRPAGEKGWYMNPTLITGVKNSHEICREELFGPVGVVLPYDSVEEAILMANDSQYGLAAAIFGPVEIAKRVARKLRVGSVYINGGGATRMDAPFGGFKKSGLGREYGEESLMEYLEPQHIQWSIE